MLSEPFSIAVFPFLKTSNTVLLGGIRFTSTEVVDHLLPRQATAVREIAQMLFAQDHMRIKTASYAIVSAVDLDRTPVDTAHLANVQAAIAYLYSSPHGSSGQPFLASEHASMALFTPSNVSIFLLRPGYNVVAEEVQAFAPDERQEVAGYAGLYDFRHHFWVAKGSRLYGPLPHPVLNISQDLSRDVLSASERGSYRLLFGLMNKSPTRTSSRVFTALRWHNSAHRQATDDYAAIVHLAIAFESLLGLPHTEKTDRLVDAIALLLGRVPRLDDWARQFYEARSHIVHEGHTENLHFVTDGRSSGAQGQRYQSLLVYGRQIFRLCLGTLLVGADLAEQAGLEERLVTNQERFERLCALLASDDLPVNERVTKAVDLVEAIDRYRFVGETGLRLETMIGAVRLGARALLDSGTNLEEPLRTALIAVGSAVKSQDHYAELDAVRQLEEAMRNVQRAEAGSVALVQQLVRVVWGATFMYYYWIKDRRPKQ